MSAKKLPLEPLAKGEFDLWAKVHVKLASPIRIAEEPPLVGYYRSFGIRTAERELKRLLEQIIDDGSIDWSETEYYEVEPRELDRVVRKRIVHPDELGVWYRGGRLLYPAVDGDD